MVSSATLVGIMFGALAPLAVWVVLLVLFFRRYKSGVKELLIGAGVFLVMALVLERIVHYFILIKIPATAAFFRQPLAYAIYGGLMAGLFEETGRFVAFRLFFKRKHRYQDGIIYGLGHGGLELLLIGVTAQVATFAQMQRTVIQIQPYLFAVSGLERILALAVQLGLSVLVLYAVARKQPKFFVLAIGLHALLDFGAAMGRYTPAPVLISEGIAAVFAVAAVIWLVRARRLFESTRSLAHS
ncbi:YhfC family glutamic-type intramembrane protease [Ethanoligenens sp.]|uniref:YhfC family glutamic-type intramembrane protease n=1 Tax=Ethanoligenens sp. TaxID=2099655 RepID=UPI0039EBE570